jgi:hypothetical protein
MPNSFSFFKPVIFSLVSTLVLTFRVNAQEDSTKLIDKLSFEGYLETYYNFDSDQPKNHNRSSLVYNHNRHNELNINVMLLSANYQGDRVRGEFGGQFGTYVQANLAHEPSALQNLYRANLGVQLLKNRQLWLDAGVLPSHLGSEGITGVEYATLSRSLVAENSPYYEAGARLSFTSENKKWYAALMYLNGWQQIQASQDDQLPDFGAQLTYTPTENIKINYSNYYGQTKSSNPFSPSLYTQRFFQDFYAQLRFGKKKQSFVSLTADYGISYLGDWAGTSLVFQQKFKQKNAISLRVEGFYDPNYAVLSSFGLLSNYYFYDVAIAGASINYDRQITDQFTWRTEIRGFAAEQPIFGANGDYYNVNVTTSLCFRIRR